MRRPSLPVCLAVALVAAACARDDRQWMKPTGNYTTAEFQRDYAECSRGGRLDEACMRARGWVSVKGQKSEDKPPEPERPVLTR